MKKKTFKNQADLFSFVLDEFVEDEETCISEFCVKNKAQAYENLKTKRNNLAEEWNRLTEERELQIRADAKADAIYEAFHIADCTHTDCWDCAFGEADICKLQMLYKEYKND